MCVYNCSDLRYLEVAASRRMVILSLSLVKNRLSLEFCNFCIEFCKKPSRITFLMHVFAGLCTGKVTLSNWMLQNTGQNVQEIDAAKCIDVILKNAQCPIDQRTKAISAVQSSWQTTRVTLIHSILTKIQSSFFQFM